MAAPSGEAGDVLPHYSLTQAFKAVAHSRLVLSLVQSIRALDSVLDSMPAKEILTLGKTEYGNHPCEFLYNDVVASTKYPDHINEIIKAGVLPATVEHAFSNIHSVLVREQAVAECDYLHDKKANSRQRMTSMDFALAQSTMLHALEHFKGEIKQSKITDSKIVQLSDFVSLYPDASKMALLYEMVDHLDDFIIDMRAEITDRKISPNWIATHLHQNGKFLGANKKINPEIENFVCKTYTKNRVPPADQPDIVQAVIRDGEKDYYEIANSLPRLLRDSVIAYWDVRKNTGMISQAIAPISFSPKTITSFSAETVPYEY